MPEEKQQHSGEYVTLRDYIDARMTAADRAVLIALAAMDKRMDAANELRGALKDLADSAVTRSKYDDDVKRIQEDIRSLRESRAELSGKASQDSLNKTNGTAIAGFIIGALGLLLSLVNIILRLYGK
jgi:hypothetical protein